MVLAIRFVFKVEYFFFTNMSYDVLVHRSGLKPIIALISGQTNKHKNTTVATDPKFNKQNHVYMSYHDIHDA